MKMNFTSNPAVTYKVILAESLDRLDIDHEVRDCGELYLTEPLPADKYKALVTELKKYGIEFLNKGSNPTCDRIRNAIYEMVHSEVPVNLKNSHYLSKKLMMNYKYMALAFKEKTGISIEAYIILLKIERAKKMLLNGFRISEIAEYLNYSSIAHLSGQFRKITGMSPSLFKKIIEIKKSLNAAITTY